MRLPTRVLIPLAALLLTTGSAAAPDDLDEFVLSQMAMRRIPGLSLAIVDNGRIVSSRAYGVTDRGGNKQVTLNTVFQAGSISKSVAALGALHLVEEGKLALDTDVNATLTSWKLPSSDFTKAKPVTLRGILSHTAGLTVHGFPGYDADSVMPSLVQVLNGSSPTNTAAIRNDVEPGAQWRYSGGGYTVMQQMMIDVTGLSFPDYMQRAVLGPLGMTQSSYDQPPHNLAAQTAAGHYLDGRIVHGRWHVYPEMAAAGLWTTPADLARFAIGVQQAYAGKSSKIISQSMARQMLTDQKDNDGLGVFLAGSGPKLWFSHNGRDEGFDASLNAAAETGQAVVIMINANDNSRLVPRIAAFVAKKYRWPNASAYVRPAPVSVPESQIAAVAGRYEVANNQMATLVPLKGHLFGSDNGLPDEEFISLGNDTFASAERDVRLAFTRDASGAITGMTRTQGATTRTAPRIGPLFSSLSQQNDPDAALSRRVEAVVRALGQGGSAMETVQGITEGARKDFGRDAWRPATGLTRLSFVAVQDISARGIERHGSKVARILYYRMTANGVETRLMVHLTADGLVTDVDIADE
ncbi:MAG: beta-lactamase [Gemmatimonadetes bacterium]|nr:beta-lactamase [Gemmatimonadota bacterium]